MPELYGWLEELRLVFGRDGMNRSIALGLKGEVTLWLKEGAHEIGKPGPLGVPASASPPKLGK